MLPAPVTKPDAIRVHHSFFGDCFGHADRVAAKLKKHFGNVLAPSKVDPGSTKFHSRMVHGTDWRLLSREAGDTWGYATDHPRYPESRYEWVNRGDGVEYGYLRDDPYAEVAPTPEEIAADQQATLDANPALKAKWFGAPTETPANV
jgi:hypothetical protein